MAVDGGVTEWSQWSGPACDCAGGSTRVLNRSRTCTNPTPANGGRFCNETLNESVTRNCNRSNCPVDGGVTEWSQWSGPACDCAGGSTRVLNRSRTCTNPTPANGGRFCNETLNESVTRNCNRSNCPVDGNVSVWTQWVNSSCSTSCGPGVSTRTRFRTCTNPSPAFGGRNCTQQLAAFEVVSFDGGVTGWSQWSGPACDCAGGSTRVLNRSRTCTNPTPANGGRFCNETLNESVTRNCNRSNCPVDGNVSVWTQWVNSSCSTSCGPGVSTRTRFRTCTNPSPAFGGRNCTQQLAAFEVVSFDGGVTEWSQWSGPACDCAGGSTRVLNRSRTCTNPTPANGGRFCNETLNESVTRNCNRSNCPVDGGVTEWSQWSGPACDCAGGSTRVLNRSRTCTNPTPANGGRFCNETLNESVTRNCIRSNCPVDGNVSVWTQWVNSSCSTSCGPGVSTRTRFRTCTNPSPAFGGRNCTQQLAAFEVVSCTEGNCPVDGGVTEWSQWSGPACDCAGGSTRVLNRSRTCTNPTPANGGRFCNETLNESVTRNCIRSNCPVDGGVTEWSQWSGPACDCAGGSTRVLNRSRTCTNPTPANGGRFCNETLNESVTRNCIRSNCPGK
ncbi:coadhesin-like [Haliotis asinina]|uniref:coadhesin-like n=1 Tax=Haliotis asinina TaxID=109174 RepID=UPI0035325B69